VTSINANSRVTGKQLAELVEKLQQLHNSISLIATNAKLAIFTLNSLSPNDISSRFAHVVSSKDGTNVGTVVDHAIEVPISFREASELVPTRPSISTISRWCTTRARGVKLESTIVGGRRKTTREAVFCFLNACRERQFAGLAGGPCLEKALAAKQSLEQRRRNTKAPPQDP
jgi:hypothetical protein